jgi:putative salt-induced outer membrane protein YdiY
MLAKQSYAWMYLAIFLLVATGIVEAELNNRDTVIMKNGDRFTCKVKKLENGILYIDTDYVSGSIGLDWLQVKKLETPAPFQVALNNGNRMAGVIEKVPTEEAPGKDFEIRAASSKVDVASPSVINIESQKQNFWQQLSGAVDFGYDFTSGNSQTSLTSDTNVNYRALNWAVGADFTSSFSGQTTGSKTNLLELQGAGTRYLSTKNSFVLALSDFLHSSQQSLDLRTTLGGGYGRYWIHTNQNLLMWIAGAVYTHEQYTSSTSQPVQENVEALLGAQYQFFRFDRYSLQSQIYVFPGLSDTGRIRAAPKATLSIKLPNNFHTDFSFWDNFDSRPPINSKRNELGISDSLGYSF